MAPPRKRTRKTKPKSKPTTTAKRSRGRGGRRRGRAQRRWVTRQRVSYVMASAFSVLILGLLALAYFMHDLPDITKLMDVKKTAPSIVLRTTNDEIIGASGHIYGEYLTYEEIPRDLIKAVIATEDRAFFRHHGLDPWGLLRATFANLRAGRIVQGGSTVTQQLAKNVFLTPERSLKRKAQEAILALWMEREYSKQQIIAVYLNRVYFGAGTYGIDAAARRYFGKSARDMMLPESAMIAGLLKAPSRYAPTNDRELAIGRATQVLINMEDAGLINEGQLEAAKKMYKTMQFAEMASTQASRYYTDWVLDQVPDYVGRIEGDLIVTTTFNPNRQKMAESAIAQVMTDEVRQARKAGQVAVVSMRPDGAVETIVGGENYGESQYNRATQALRQPGSAFKLFVYLAALENRGYTPSSLTFDAPITVSGWSPSNYSNEYEGEVSLRHAFAQSLNTVAVRLSEEVGRIRVIEMARRLGLKAKMDNVPSIALGVTESTLLAMTTAYSHLASGGQLVMPYGIVAIHDAYGNELYRRQQSGQLQVIQPNIVRQMNDMLLAVVEEGTGRGAAIGRPAAGKTGTSQDFRDAWFIGFTPQLTTGVWVGNDNNAPMQRVTGGNLPAQIWRSYMQAALSGVAVESIPRSEGRRSIFQRTPGSSGGARNNFWDSLFENIPEPDPVNDNEPVEPDRDRVLRR